MSVITIDLNFKGLKNTIAVYLIPYPGGAVLIECGPGSAQKELIEGLQQHGFRSQDITDVLVTHIHLDHAGSAGWWSRQGARIHVHPVGAPHLENPDKLISSASRIYGEQMEALWGEILPVAPQSLVVHQDGETIRVGNLEFLPLDTPGHAYHHYAYLFEDLCFSGDIGGVRIPGYSHLRVPMPPPEFHLEKWRESLFRLQTFSFRKIAPTHFGIFNDASIHLEAMLKALDEVELFLQEVMPQDLPMPALQEKVTAWARQRTLSSGVPQAIVTAYELANPTIMSAAGIQRYWQKHRRPIDGLASAGTIK